MAFSIQELQGTSLWPLCAKTSAPSLSEESQSLTAMEGQGGVGEDWAGRKMQGELSELTLRKNGNSTWSPDQPGQLCRVKSLIVMIRSQGDTFVSSGERVLNCWKWFGGISINRLRGRNCQSSGGRKSWILKRIFRGVIQDPENFVHQPAGEAQVYLKLVWMER